MNRLDGRIAIVTGATRGTGESEARLLAAEGARVVVTDVLEKDPVAAAADGRGARPARGAGVVTEDAAVTVRSAPPSRHRELAPRLLGPVDRHRQRPEEP